MNLFLFAFLLFMANKTNSFIRYSGDSTARLNCFRFYLTFSNLTHRVLGGGRCRQTGLAASAGSGNTGSNQQQITVTKAECCCAMGAAWGSAENSANSTFGKLKS